MITSYNVKRKRNLKKKPCPAIIVNHNERKNFVLKSLNNPKLLYKK